MNVTAPGAASTSIVARDNAAYGSAWSEGYVCVEQVRSGQDRRRRHDRRTEDQVQRRMEYGLEELVWDGTPVPPPARILAAARLFAEGNHFFTGQIVDRTA